VAETEMVFDQEELLDIVMRITPEHATSEEALRSASETAVAQIDAVLALADRAAAGALGHHAKMETRAFTVMRELVRRRKNALMKAGAYRTLKTRAAEHRAFYG
jgi:hypothetical protein